VWDGKVEAILESEKYTTLMVNELFSKLKSAVVDCGLTARLESPTDSRSLALVGGTGSMTNANPSSRMYSLSSLMYFPDEEFDVLGEDELALLTRRFERMHKNRLNSRRNSRVCFKCGKTEHFFAVCPKVNNHDNHKSKDKRRKSKKKDHGHGKTRPRQKMKRSSDIESDSEDTLSILSDEDEEGDKKKKKNFNKYLNDLCVMGLSSKDDFYDMAHGSSSMRSQKDTSDSDSEDEVCDDLSSLR
jgi:hypothetical protein